MVSSPRSYESQLRALADRVDRLERARPSVPHMRDLADAHLREAQDGHVPVYRAATGLWHPEPAGGGGGGGGEIYADHQPGFYDWGVLVGSSGATHFGDLAIDVAGPSRVLLLTWATFEMADYGPDSYAALTLQPYQEPWVVVAAAELPIPASSFARLTLNASGLVDLGAGTHRFELRLAFGSGVGAYWAVNGYSISAIVGQPVPNVG